MGERGLKCIFWGPIFHSSSMPGRAMVRIGGSHIMVGVCYGLFNQDKKKKKMQAKSYLSNLKFWGMYPSSCGGLSSS